MAEVNFLATEALVLATVRRQWRSKFLTLALVFTFFCSVLLCFFFKRPWYLLLGLGLSALPLGLYALLQQQARSALESLTSRRICWEFSEDGIAIKADTETKVLSWKELRKIRCFPDVWIFTTNDRTYSSIPTMHLKSR